jgi:hypothetical protein
VDRNPSRPSKITSSKKISSKKGTLKMDLTAFPVMETIIGKMRFLSPKFEGCPGNLNVFKGIANSSPFEVD